MDKKTGNFLYSVLAFLTIFYSSGFAVPGEDLRILKLLPFLEKPPLVDPCIPDNFILGEADEGYYWGAEGTLSDYFEDPSHLKGCLIRAQISNRVTQLGHDRFSCDRNTQDLAAAGFTEIKLSRGRWGIFPYRELLAKGPRGRRYYQVWVGLNSQEGTTLCFQLLYPEYLREPTQTQKNLWANFIKKTALLGIDELLMARGASFKTKSPELKLAEYFSVEKRRSDQKFLVRLAPYRDHFSSIKVLKVEDHMFSKLKLEKFSVEIDSLFTLVTGSTLSEKISVPYLLVEEFSFSTKMLSPKNFEDRKTFFVLR